MDDIRIAKFETLIGDINEAIERYSYRPSGVNSPLYMVFEPETLNEYSKTICSIAHVALKDNGSIYHISEPWHEKYGAKHFGDVKMKIDAAKDFAKYCREDDNRQHTHLFSGA
jgi:hypothetical protein